ncbi:hypothetical protein DEU56DRAFT_901836 [Suillus clintonianus]|uniref:uncharacterized protein n=1 Tax=Suillus clintonianus TaxID=1904413 RepID=UPI001B865520|nr:uncharacterized protein DEU56DRAFT_901836 [Suillus clintonianus]KAG2135297.1 hypothetical protein DEU56DRAFT_901836 [Suillus clintonianus]
MHTDHVSLPGIKTPTLYRKLQWSSLLFTPIVLCIFAYPHIHRRFYLHPSIDMFSNKHNICRSSCSSSLSSALSLVFIFDVLKLVALVFFYVVVIMAGLAFDVYSCQPGPTTVQDPVPAIDFLRPQEAKKAARPSKVAPSSATGGSDFPSSSSSPAILESSLDSPRLVPEVRLRWSISCSDISPQLHDTPIGPHHHVHALFSDAWNENTILLKQLLCVQDNLDVANADIDELVVENATLSHQMDRLTRDLEIKQVRRDEADSMCQDATIKMSSQRATISSLQSANAALRFELANLRAERDELAAERKEPSDLQKEHDEEVEALQGTLVRTKRELEGAKRELRKLKRAAAGIPELQIISPDGKVIPHGNASSSTDSLTEDQSIAMRERLTLAYTEVVSLRDQCKALCRRADENAELQDDVKQLLAQRSGLWDQVESAKSACHTLEEENKKYFHQYVEIRAALTKVERRTGIAISVIEEEEEEPEVSPDAQGCRSAFDDDSDDESITSSTSCYSMASTDDFDTSLHSEVYTPHTSVPSSPCSPPLSPPPSPPFTMPSWVPRFDSDCTNFAFAVVPESPLADAISAYVGIHQPIEVSHRRFVTRRGLGIPIVRPSWPSVSSIIVPLDEASPKRKFTLDLDDAMPKTRRCSFGLRWCWFRLHRSAGMLSLGDPDEELYCTLTTNQSGEPAISDFETTFSADWLSVMYLRQRIDGNSGNRYHRITVHNMRQSRGVTP